MAPKTCCCGNPGGIKCQRDTNRAGTGVGMSRDPAVARQWLQKLRPRAKGAKLTDLVGKRFNQRIAVEHFERDMLKLHWTDDDPPAIRMVTRKPNAVPFRPPVPHDPPLIPAVEPTPRADRRLSPHRSDTQLRAPARYASRT